MSGMLIFALICAVLAIVTAAIAAFGPAHDFQRRRRLRSEIDRLTETLKWKPLSDKPLPMPSDYVSIDERSGR